MALDSIGVTDGIGMARIEVATFIRLYHQLEQKIQELMSQLTNLANTSMEYEWLSTVPGKGDTTIIELLSGIGSFSYYQHPRQLIKLAGVTLCEHSSGQHRGKKRISKRGRRHLRILLFRVMLSMVRCNTALRQLHVYYTPRAKNPLCKKQSIVVLCGKLLKILYALGTKQVVFDAQRMLKDTPSLEGAV